MNRFLFAHRIIRRNKTVKSNNNLLKNIKRLEKGNKLELPLRNRIFLFVDICLFLLCINQVQAEISKGSSRMIPNFEVKNLINTFNQHVIHN